MSQAGFVFRLFGSLAKYTVTGRIPYNNPTNKVLEAQRKKEIEDAFGRVLKSMVAAGDYLDSETRYEFVKEAFNAHVGLGEGCEVCKTTRSACMRPGTNFHDMNQKLQHTYSTESAFRDVAHAVVNIQGKFDAAMFQAVAKRAQEHFGVEKDEALGITLELIALCSMCNSLNAYYIALGEGRPPLPARVEPVEPATFKKVSDFAKSRVLTNMDIAHGPFVAKFNQKVLRGKLHLSYKRWIFNGASETSPGARVTIIPITGSMWMELLSILYMDECDIPMMLEPLKRQHHLCRAHVESVAQEYATSLACAF